MNGSAFISFYRALARHRLYAAFNIGGLAVGIAVFLVLGLYVRFETSYEKWLPRHDGIYAVRTIWSLEGSPFNGAYPSTMGGLLDQMKQDFPGLVGTRVRTGGTGVVRGGVTTKEDLVQVDRDFFRVFDLPMVRGDRKTALADPTAAIISESMARKYFGSTDPVGQAMTVTMDTPQTYRITGIFADLPRNTELKMSIIMLLPTAPPQEQWYHWGSTTLQTYVRFATPAAARAFVQKMPAFVNRRAFADMGKDATKTINLDVIPFHRLHLEPEGSGSPSRKITVTTLGLVGLLTLLIAIVNYVNLATARAGLRAREVAMRKVLGASRAALMRQFIGEAMLTVAIAALVGLILAELGLPLVNAAGGLALSLPYATVVPALALLVLVVGIAAGFYPALLLSRYPAAAVLASARSPGGGRAGARVREALVVLQFGLAIAFMIGTVVLLAQTRHVRRADLGYTREGLVTVMSMTDNLVTPERRRAVVDAIRRLPDVTDVTMANDAVGESGSKNSDNVPLPGVAGDGPSLRWILTGPRFFDTYGARLIAGRLFDDARRDDDAQPRKSADGLNIVINRSAVPVLGFRSPQAAIGKTVGGERPRTIIGVVDDLRFGSPRNPAGPTYYLYYREVEKAGTIVATVRHSGDPRAVIDRIRGIWRRLAPQVPFDAETADRRLTEFYRADDRATRLFGIGAALAVLIGCVGLWGLASFNTARRIKEIGIRKTLGASSADIVKLLVGQFLRPVLIANLVAWPLAWFAMRTWLAGFSDAIALSPLYFLGASVIAVVIAVLTVLGQSLRASRAAPAWALRHD